MNKYNKLIALGAVFYAIGLAAYILASYMTSTADSRAAVDYHLSRGIDLALTVFPEEAMGRALAGEMSPEEYESYVTSLDEAALAMDYEYIYLLVKRDGEIVYLASTLSEEERQAGEILQPFSEYDAAEGDAAVFTAGAPVYMESADEYGEFRSVLTPRKVAGETVVVGVDIDIADLQAIYRQDLLKSCLTGLFFIAISLPLFFFIYRKVRADKNALALAVEQQTTEISGLNAQLEEKMAEVSREAEASAAAAAQAKSAQEEALQARRDGIQQAGKQVDEVLVAILPISQELPGIIAESAQGARAQKEQAEKTAEALREMSAVVGTAAENARGVAESSDRSRAKAEGGAQLVSAMGAEIQAMSESIQSLKESMHSLSDRVGGIDSVIGVINDIADQTNLLALNAAIEAARAGEAGRGFAVVADEVRKLAEKTMLSTKEVGEAVRSIQDSTNNTALSVDRTTAQVVEVSEKARQAGDALAEIVGLANDVSGQVRNIAAIVEEQAAGTGEITQAMQEIDGIAINIVAAMERCDAAARALNEGTAKMDALVRELNSAV